MRGLISNYAPEPYECSPEEATRKFYLALNISKGKSNTTDAFNCARRKTSTPEDIARLYSEEVVPISWRRAVYTRPNRKSSKGDRFVRSEDKRRVNYKDTFWFKACERKGVKMTFSNYPEIVDWVENAHEHDEDKITVRPLTKWGSADNRSLADNADLGFGDQRLANRWHEGASDKDLYAQRDIAQFMKVMAKVLPEPTVNGGGEPVPCDLVQDGRVLHVLATAYHAPAPMYAEIHSEKPVCQSEVVRFFNTVVSEELKGWLDVSTEDMKDMVVGFNPNCTLTGLLTTNYSQLRYKMRSQERVRMALEALEYMGLMMYSNTANSWANVTSARRGLMELFDRVISGRNKFITMVKKGYEVSMVRDEIVDSLETYAAINCGQKWKFKPRLSYVDKTYEELLVKNKKSKATKTKSTEPQGTGIFITVGGKKVEITV